MLATTRVESNSIHTLTQNIFLLHHAAIFALKLLKNAILKMLRSHLQTERWPLRHLRVLFVSTLSAVPIGMCPCYQILI